MWRAAFGFILLNGCATVPQVACPPPKLERFVGLVRLGADRFLLALGPTRLSAEDVECLARAGEKPMQYELAQRLEKGDGIAPDLVRAEALYSAAAQSISGMTYVYMPPACSKCAGMVMPVRTGPDIPGLPEATFALARMQIEGRSTRPDYRGGLKRMERLAKSGFPPAVAYLAALRERRA